MKSIKNYLVFITLALFQSTMHVTAENTYAPPSVDLSLDQTYMAQTRI